MRIFALALALLAASARAADAPVYTSLPPGRYSVSLHGMLCSVCARAIAAEWAKLPEVEKATVDLDRETGYVTIRLDRSLKVAALGKAMRRAERTANLGARFALSDIKYIP